MAQIVNLRRARKDKARAEKDAKAAKNRAAHGTSKDLRDLAKARREQEIRKTDGNKLDKA